MFGDDLWISSPISCHVTRLIKILKYLIIKMLNLDLIPTGKKELVLQLESGKTEVNKLGSAPSTEKRRWGLHQYEL